MIGVAAGLSSALQQRRAFDNFYQVEYANQMARLEAMQNISREPPSIRIKPEKKTINTVYFFDGESVYEALERHVAGWAG